MICFNVSCWSALLILRVCSMSFISFLSVFNIRICIANCDAFLSAFVALPADTATMDKQLMVTDIYTAFGNLLIAVICRIPLIAVKVKVRLTKIILSNL